MEVSHTTLKPAITLACPSEAHDMKTVEKQLKDNTQQTKNRLEYCFCHSIFASHFPTYKLQKTFISSHCKNDLSFLS